MSFEKFYNNLTPWDRFMGVVGIGNTLFSVIHMNVSATLGWTCAFCYWMILKHLQIKSRS